MNWADCAGSLAVVTGGASGIGLAIVEEALKRQLKVAISDTDSKALATVQQRFGSDVFV
jgi:NAD(P)-dependent dehydrogenase (short-subunit alcohol dehydrogenase family)